ncbi:hypothetical protein, partial [Moorena sp. SIO4G3]|uniref:hypothetical protein n=1 Tax=Moorena sp. SIO4G3 TaxID=2607821 RepID=UPI002600646A
SEITIDPWVRWKVMVQHVQLGSTTLHIADPVDDRSASLPSSDAQRYKRSQHSPFYITHITWIGLAVMIEDLRQTTLS